MATRLAIELPDALVAAIDQLVDDGTFPTRSATVRRALDGLVAAKERAAVDAAFARGFGAVRETAEELSDATQLAVESVNDEPWDE